MSKYYVNKFLYTVDRDPGYLDAYAKDAKDFVRQWEDEIGPQLLSNAGEKTTVLSFTDEEREALVNHDYVALFELGAHFFLNLTLFIAVYDESWTQEKGPLSFQREFGARLQHWLGKPYPSVAT
ncbi:hypothetical protein ACQ856_29965 (plasmid) [Mycolicibacterium psychrotolerans]|uniref:hypothetical protein n=1 Tax=Mycolicibacterium psychrotolerans TaxID=216929 RepID=UPI003D6769AF